MKRFLSAFALSLSFSLGCWGQSLEVDEFLEIETVPIKEGEQKFVPTDLHDDEEWEVTPAEAAIDLPLHLKGQRYAITPWSEGPEKLLDIRRWMSEREIKDRNPNWLGDLRQQLNHELAGKILSCQGLCEVYRGLKKAPVSHLSRLLEGDELHTGEDSVAWAYMMDGSLVRLGPRGQLAVKEINFSKDEVFILLRLGEGHLFWHPRPSGAVVPEVDPETDVTALPLLVREANLAHFQRQLFREEGDNGELHMLGAEERGITAQVQALNDLRTANNKIVRRSRSMVVTPNATLNSLGVSFDLVHVLGGQSYLKKRPGEGELSLQLRGYTEDEHFPILATGWLEVDPPGRLIGDLQDPPGALQVLELLTKRITTLELARELWLQRFSRPILEFSASDDRLGQEHGYLVWSAEKLQKRLAFLFEYTRRMETTNLRSIANLLNRQQRDGEFVRAELSTDLYQDAVNRYLLGLKSRYTEKAKQVREMSDLQYYVWILRNGKQWNQAYFSERLPEAKGTHRSPWDSF